MAVKKISVALDENVAASAALAAEEAGLSLSAWLNQAAMEKLKIFEGLRAMEELWEMIGPPTAEEEARAQAKVDETMAAIEAMRRRKAGKRRKSA
jgi:high-affinity K+ transport system ATPase subunit B